MVGCCSGSYKTMDRLVGLITSASKTRSSNDDDFTDRLSSRYTVVLLVVFAILVSMNQYVRNPITCWAPKHFTGAHSKYTTNYCWIRNTYYLPWDAPLPRRHANRQMIPYYQWIPFILLGQAIFFYMPTIFWHGLNSRVLTSIVQRFANNTKRCSCYYIFVRFMKTPDDKGRLVLYVCRTLYR